MLSFCVFAYTEPRSAHENPGLSAAFPPRAVLDRRRHACSLFSLPAFHYIATPLFPYFLIDRHRDERSVTVTPLVSADYKCPLAQLLSLHILTNAPGVWGSALLFLKCYFNFSCARHSMFVKSPLFSPFLFMRLRTLSFSVSRKPFACHSYENNGGVPKQFPF